MKLWEGVPAKRLYKLRLKQLGSPCLERTQRFHRTGVNVEAKSDNIGVQPNHPVEERPVGAVFAEHGVEPVRELVSVLHELVESLRDTPFAHGPHACP